MLTTERFPWTNDDQEDRAETDKTWSAWKAGYKKAHTKARIKTQANEGFIKFCGANLVARVETTQDVKKNKASKKEA